jgi:hypothetical protein
MGIALSSFVMMVVFGNRIEVMYPNSPITQVVKSIDHAIFPDNIPLYADLNDAASEPVYSKNYDLALTKEPSNMAVFAAITIHDKETITSPTDLKKENKAKIKAEKKSHKLEKKKARMMNRLEKSRLASAAISGAAAVILIILLLAPLCAGICLIAGAFGNVTVGSVILGIILLGGSILGIIKLANRNKRKIKTEQ